MDMLNPHCGIDRDSRGVVRLTICNAGKLNIVSSAVTNGVREGFEHLAADHSIRAVILAGESERSMIGGADIKEMATLDQKSAEGFISRLRDLCEAVRKFPAPVIARLPGWCLGGGLEVAWSEDQAGRLLGEPVGLAVLAVQGPRCPGGRPGSPRKAEEGACE